MTNETTLTRTTPRPVEVTQGQGRRGGWTYRPSVDIFETPEHVLLHADLPGADASSIDVSLEAGILTIQADVPPRMHGDAQCLAHEYGIGGFHRRFEIDEAIDAEAVSADYRNGELIVRLPKAPQARRRRIPVSA